MRVVVSWQINALESASLCTGAPAIQGETVRQRSWSLGFFRSRKPVQVNVGNRYQVGESPLMVWEVANLFQGIDGTPSAHIFCVADPSRRKTVAQNALEAGNQYVRIPDAHAH
jgi:hypothetical protein